MYHIREMDDNLKSCYRTETISHPQAYTDNADTQPSSSSPLETVHEGKRIDNETGQSAEAAEYRIELPASK